MHCSKAQILRVLGTENLFEIEGFIWTSLGFKCFHLTAYTTALITTATKTATLPTAPGSRPLWVTPQTGCHLPERYDWTQSHYSLHTASFSRYSIVHNNAFVLLLNVLNVQFVIFTMLLNWLSTHPLTHFFGFCVFKKCPLHIGKCCGAPGLFWN